jgi:general secretion pathway protein J
MTGSVAAGRTGEHGFTLIETLVALALMGLVLSALANITAQWLPNWNRGVDRIQRGEMVGMALQRIGADLAAAEYVSANREAKQPLFEGSELSVMFVRTAMGPNAGSGLDLVRIGETNERQGLVTVRSQTTFGPLSPGASLSEQIHLGNPVVLLRAPFRLSFAYLGQDRIWKRNWHDADKLPVAVKLTVRDAASERVLSVPIVVTIHAEAPAVCAQTDSTCDGKSAGEQNPQANPQGAPPTGSAPAGLTMGQGRS